MCVSAADLAGDGVPPSGTQRFGMIMPQLDDNYVYVPEGDRQAPTVLPEGVMRISADGMAAQRLLTPEPARVCAGEASARELALPVRIAALISTARASGELPCAARAAPCQARHAEEVGHRAHHGVGGRLQAETAPKTKAGFAAWCSRRFEGSPSPRSTGSLRDFYEERVEGIFRDEIDRLMRRHLEAGDVVICVSATFEPIIAKAMTCHPIQFGIATRMQIDGDGCYTDRVDGLPVEGSEKVVALTAFADELFGAGNWQLDWAYGDHHSDRDLLAAAQHGCAVTPDRPLARTARERGYDVLDIDE